jgi:hypothetical protein
LIIVKSIDFMANADSPHNFHWIFRNSALSSPHWKRVLSQPPHT